MYVRKFEADSLDEALKNIKKELGPDAIILKTVTNKGLKGAFKKNKIEITAAISEKNYTKKAKVDRVLDSEQKNKFYANNASYISNMIDSHAKADERFSDAAENSTAPSTTGQSSSQESAYGKLALNRQVKSTKESGRPVGPSLDDFLKQKSKKELPVELGRAYSDSTMPRGELNSTNTSVALNEFLGQNKNSTADENIVAENYSSEMVDSGRIEELEKQIYLLSRQVQEVFKKEPTGLYQLRNSLRSLDISEIYINNLAKKMMFDLSEKDLDSVEIVYEFALKEMLKDVHVEMPLFSRPDSESVITVLLSETSSGQSSMAIKLAVLKNDSVIITNDLQKDQKNSFVENKRISFAEKIFDLTIIHTASIAEIVSECRKAEESGRSVFIDYKNFNKEINEARRFVEGLQRSFHTVEVLVSLSSIHTELYNKKIMTQYRKIANGIILSHLDLCLNFGALFNLTSEMRDLPFKFYGTGDIIPDDLESATAERILAGIFQLD